MIPGLSCVPDVLVDRDLNQQGSLKEMAPANNAFSLQVTNELVQKLAKENIVAKRPARKAPAPKPSVKPLEAPLVTKQGLPLPFYRGFLSGVPGINKEQAYQQSQEQKHDLVPIYKVLEETENLNKKLQMQENSELEKVKQLAQELQDRQFRAPSYPIPCQAEKERCLQCYRGSPESPVECAEAVRMYKECSQRVQQDFAERVATSQLWRLEGLQPTCNKLQADFLFGDISLLLVVHNPFVDLDQRHKVELYSK